MTRKLSPCFLCISLTLLSAALHPGWYGDGLWYAEAILQGDYKADFGHLAWLPLAGLLHEISGFSALFSLQVLSLSGCFFCLLGIWYFFSSDSRLKTFRLAAVILFAASNFNISYAASGSSYHSALAAFIWSFHFLNQGRFLASICCINLAFFSWALALLAAPSLAALLVFRREMSTAIKYSAVSAGIWAVSICTIFLLSAEDNQSLSAWMGSSGHSIAIGFSIKGVFRSLVGIVQTFFALGFTSSALKAALLGDLPTFSSSFSALQVLAPLGLGLFFITLLAGFWRELRALELALLAGFAFNFLFATLWQGSDVERFSPSVLALVTLLFSLLSASKRAQELTVLTLLVLTFHNLSYRILPPFYSATGDYRWLARELGKLEGPPPALILTGQKLGAHTWAPAYFFARSESFHFLYDSSTNGERGWKLRLLKFIEDQREQGRRVWAVEQALGLTATKDTLIVRGDLPHPSQATLREFFAPYELEQTGLLGGYQFFELRSK